MFDGKYVIIFQHIYFKNGQYNIVGYVMVEPRLIYAPNGVCMSRPKIVYRSKGLYTVGGKIL